MQFSHASELYLSVTIVPTQQNVSVMEPLECVYSRPKFKPRIVGIVHNFIYSRKSNSYKAGKHLNNDNTLYNALYKPFLLL